MARTRKASVEIHPFASADAAAVDAVLQTLWGHDPPTFENYRFMHCVWPEGSALRRTLVAVAAGAVVGAGSLFHNALSPGRLMLTINVAAGWQRRGIGSALFDALAALSDGRPWLSRVAPQRDPAGWAFLTTRGFRPVISTTTGMLDPQSEAVRAWVATLPVEVRGYRIVRTDAPDCPASPEQLALVHAALARQYHMWNPVIEVSPQVAIAIFCGEKVIAGSQLCVYAGDELVGAAHLTHNPFKPDTEEAYLANWGVVGDQPSANDVTAALMRRCLEFAAGRGLHVGVEADDPYVPHLALLQASPATNVRRDWVHLVND